MNFSPSAQRHHLKEPSARHKAAGSHYGRVTLHPVLQHQTLVVPCSMDQVAMLSSLFLRE